MDQELVIPDVEPKEPTVSLAQEILDQQIQPISGATYTVVPGDSLWNIAVRAYGDGYRWTDIAVENELVNPDLIHAGNVLVLPR
jgi:nucleoid-associated protein YgaU